MPSEAEKRSVSGWRRVLVAGVVAVTTLLVALFAVVAAIVVFEIDLGRMKPLIVSLISDELGREVRIDGKLSVRVGRQVEFNAEDVVLANKEWAGSEPMVTIARLDGAVRPITILLDPLHFFALTVEDAEIRLVANEDGQANWDFPEDPESWLDRWGDPDAPIILETLRVRDAGVTVSAPALEAPVAIGIASIEHAVVDEQLTSRIDGRVNDVPLAFEGRIGPRAALRDGGPVEFGYEGELGEIEFETRGSLDDLLNPQRPAIELALEGPDVEYLFGLLNTRAITRGPLDVQLTVSRGQDRIDARAAGTVGEFNVEAEGWTSDVESFRDAYLAYSAGGPNIDHVGTLVGFERLPESAFRANGAVSKAGERLTVEPTELEIGDSVFTLSGEVADISRFGASDLTLRARGDDIARFRGLIGVPGILDGPFDVTARLTPTDGAHGRLDIDGVIDDIRKDITLYPSGEDDFAGSRAEFDLRGPSLAEIGRAVDVQGLPDRPFRVFGRAEYRVSNVALDDVSIEIVDSVARLSGDVDLDFPGSVTDLAVGVESPDLGELLAAFGSDGAPSVPLDYASRLRIDESGLRITDLDALLAKTRITGSTTIALEPIASPVTFDLDIDAGSLAGLLPENDWLEPADVPVTAGISGSYDAERLEIGEALVEIGDARVAIDGIIDRPPSLSATNVAIDAEIPSLAALGSNARGRLPEKRVTLTGRFTGEGNRVTGRDVTMSLGENVIDTEFAYTAADVPEIRLRLASPFLDLRPFLPEPDEEAGEPPPASTGDRLIPEVEIPVDVLEAANVDAELSVKRLVTHVAEYHDVGLTGEVENGDLDIGHFGVRGRVGRIDGTLSYMSSEGDRKLDLALTGDNVSFAPQGLPVEEVRKRPTYHVDIDLAGTGATLRRLLATLDGRVLMHSSGGVMPKRSSWLMNMFFGDFGMEVLDTVNPLTRTSTDVNLVCAVMMLRIRDGVVSGDPAIVAQMPKLHIFAKGTIDLESEAIDVDFNTHVRKGIGLSVGDLVNPVTKVGGTLAKPTLAIDEEGVILEGGAAIATGGLSVLAKNLHQRFLADKNPCDTALETYRRAVESDASQ